MRLFGVVAHPSRVGARPCASRTSLSRTPALGRRGVVAAYAGKQGVASARRTARPRRLGSVARASCIGPRRSTPDALRPPFSPRPGLNPTGHFQTLPDALFASQKSRPSPSTFEVEGPREGEDMGKRQTGGGGPRTSGSTRLSKTRIRAPDGPGGKWAL